MAPDSTPALTIPEASPDESLDISRAVATGIKWKAITQVISEGSRVIVTLVLARILDPADYGVAGMATVCASFASLFTDPALGTALVQRRKITEADRSTVFWTTLAIGAVATVIGIAVSGYVADLFGQHEVKKLFMVTSLGFVVSGLAVTQTALLTRDLAYRSLEIREIVATLVAAACAIGVAVAGFGPWAIITNWLVFIGASAVLLWFMTAWRPTFTYSRASLSDLGSFGSRVFGARILLWGNANMDNVLVGRYLGAPALGAYALAYNLMYVPLTRVSLPIISVLSPAYARMQEDRDRLQIAFLRSKRLISTVLSPLFLAAIVVAPDLVRVAFGSKWHAAVVPLQLLSLAGLAQSLVGLHWSVLTALDRPGTLLRLHLLVTGLTLAAFIAGLPFGIVGVAAFYAGARWLLVLVDTKITTRAVSFPFWRTLSSGTEMLPLAAAMATAGFAARQLLIHDHAPPVVRLVVASLVMLVAYVGLLRLVAPTLYREVMSTVRQGR